MEGLCDESGYFCRHGPLPATFSTSKRDSPPYTSVGTAMVQYST